MDIKKSGRRESNLPLTQVKTEKPVKTKAPETTALPKDKVSLSNQAALSRSCRAALEGKSRGGFALQPFPDPHWKRRNAPVLAYQQLLWETNSIFTDSLNKLANSRSLTPDEKTELLNNLQQLSQKTLKDARPVIPDAPEQPVQEIQYIEWLGRHRNEYKIHTYKIQESYIYAEQLKSKNLYQETKLAQDPCFPSHPPDRLENPKNLTSAYQVLLKTAEKILNDPQAYQNEVFACVKDFPYGLISFPAFHHLVSGKELLTGTMKAITHNLKKICKMANNVNEDEFTLQPYLTQRWRIGDTGWIKREEKEPPVLPDYRDNF